MEKFLLICISIFMGISTSVLANGNLETEPLVQNENYGTSYDYVEN